MPSTTFTPFTTLPDPVARLLSLPRQPLLELPHDRRLALQPSQLEPASQEVREAVRAA